MQFNPINTRVQTQAPVVNVAGAMQNLNASTSGLTNALFGISDTLAKKQAEENARMYDVQKQNAGFAQAERMAQVANENALSQLAVGDKYSKENLKLGQEFTAKENQAGRDFTSGQNALGREFQTKEREKTQEFTSAENQKKMAQEQDQFNKNAELELTKIRTQASQFEKQFSLNKQNLGLQREANLLKAKELKLQNEIKQQNIVFEQRQKNVKSLAELGGTQKLVNDYAASIGNKWFSGDIDQTSKKLMAQEMDRAFNENPEFAQTILSSGKDPEVLNNVMDRFFNNGGRKVVEKMSYSPFEDASMYVPANKTGEPDNIKRESSGFDKLKAIFNRF